MLCESLGTSLVIQPLAKGMKGLIFICCLSNTLKMKNNNECLPNIELLNSDNLQW